MTNAPSVRTWGMSAPVMDLSVGEMGPLPRWAPAIESTWNQIRKITRPAQTPLGPAVLDLLPERPMHPDEIGETITQRRVNEIVKVRGGSLYHAVERLPRAGLIEAVETERRGRRPEGTVYRITEPGREEFVGWLEEALRM